MVVLPLLCITGEISILLSLSGHFNLFSKYVEMEQWTFAVTGVVSVVTLHFLVL